MSDYHCFNPFGTLIVKHRVPDNLFQQIEILVDQVRPQLSDPTFVQKTSFSEYLAGRNSYQVKLPDNFCEYIGLDSYLIDIGQVFIKEFQYKNNNLGMGNAWINFTYQGDFNSIHTHDSLLSGIIYIKQDQEIFEEANQTISSRTKGSLPGGTHFVYDLNHTYPFNRSNFVNHFVQQEIIMFPSWLTHYVNPFRCNAERITLAFNILED